MMRNFTKLFVLVAAMGMTTMAQAQFDVIWPQSDDIPATNNSQFSGGLNDWVAVSVSTPDSTKADSVLWRWSADGTVRGTFSTLTPIGSATVDNGAAVFETDWLDNRGLGRDANGNIDWSVFGFGQGPATSPPGSDVNANQEARIGHRGELISPPLDFSTEAEVGILFTQSYRKLVAAGGNSQFTFLDVSTDGGNTWTSTPINTELGVNDATDPNDVVYLDLSDQIGGQSDVRVRFVFDGYYYYWMIDDVQFVRPPSVVTSLGAYLYEVNFRTPASQIDGESINFEVNVSNTAQDLINAVISVEIAERDATNGDVLSILYSDSLEVDTIAGGIVDSGYVFPNSYTFEDILPGRYSIVYRLSADNIDLDLDPRDNAVGEFFEVTDDIYSMIEDFGGGGIRPGVGGEYAIANLYKTGAQNWDNGIYTATNIGFSGVMNAGDGILAGRTAIIYLLEVIAEDSPDFATTINGSEGVGDNEFVILRGLTEYTFQEAGTSESAVVDILDAETFDLGVDLDPDKYYMVAVQYLSPDEIIFHGFVSDRFNYFQTSTMVFAGGTWNTAGVGADAAADISMLVQFQVSTDATFLSDELVTVGPNPTTDFINVQMDFEEPTEANLIVTDINGIIVHYQEFDQVQDQNVQVNVSDYTGGTYIVNVNTPEGISSTKVSIIK